jgi:hypothetical protein
MKNELEAALVAFHTKHPHTEYVAFNNLDDICLDGNFSLAELRDIVSELDKLATKEEE